MRNVFATIIGITIFGFVLSLNALAQEAGDFRSAASGDWSAAATWETYDGTSWDAASDAPTGAETITVSGEHEVSIDVAVSVSGTLRVTDSGVVTVTGGSLEIADGGTYEHARNDGSLPSATWAEGSTALFTGITTDAPDNRGQDYHHVVLNTPDQSSNLHLSLADATVGGDIRVIDTGSARWYLASASSEETAEVTIMGDVLVEGGQFAVQGTGNALTTFIVHHYGDIEVTGGNFSIGRGSQGSGSGTTTWNLYGGNFVMSDAATQNSNPTPGNAKFVFAAGGTQQLTFTNVDYAGGDIHYEVSDSTTLEITSDFELNGQLVNRGTVDAQGDLTVVDGGIYEHARNGGDVPSATWEEGSTVVFTGVTTDAPGNRGQDYHDVVLNTPDQASNLHLSLTDATVSGDIRVVDTGSARWYLTSASAEETAEVTLMGDVLVEGGQFAVQGTGNALTTFVVHHHGDVNVTGGNFSIARGSQGNGSGTTTWNLYGGDFSMENAESQNSNPTAGNAKFVFAGTERQELTLGEGNDISNLSIEVADSSTLDLGVSELDGSGIFWLPAGATLATSHADGVAGSIQTTGDVSLSTEANYAFNGSVAQVTSTLMPTVVNDLYIVNDAGVTLSQETTINGVLTLAAGEFDNTIPFVLGPGASISMEGGTLAVPVSAEVEDELPAEFALHQNYPNPFNPSTVIRYDIRERADVTVRIFDAAGREVAELVRAAHTPGSYEVEWNAQGFSSGVYFYQIRAGDWSATRSLLLVK